MAPNQKQGPYPSESIEENQYYRMIKMGTHFFFAPIFIIQSKCRTKKSTPIADESLKFESTLNINVSVLFTDVYDRFILRGWESKHWFNDIGPYGDFSFAILGGLEI